MNRKRSSNGVAEELTGSVVPRSRWAMATDLESGNCGERESHCPDAGRPVQVLVYGPTTPMPIGRISVDTDQPEHTMVGEIR